MDTGAGKCISGSAYMQAAQKQADAIRSQAHVEAALNIALALWQRNASQSITSMQEEIADRNVQLAENIFAHAIKFWPCQADLVDQTFGVGKTPINAEALSEQYSELGRQPMNDSESLWFSLRSQTCRSATGCEIAHFSNVRSLMQVDIENFGLRQAAARAQSLDDVRYARQYSALALGKGLIRDANSFHQAHAVAGLSAGALLTGAINSGAEAIGYHMRRNRNGQPKWDQASTTSRLPYRIDKDAGLVKSPEGYILPNENWLQESYRDDRPRPVRNLSKHLSEQEDW